MARALSRAALLTLFAFAAPAYADPIKYAIVNATFDDGGTATGYVLYEAQPPPASPLVTDWAITVMGGTTGIRPFDYDPTNSTVSFTSDLMTFVATPSLVSLCAGVPRSIQFGLLQFGALASETCQVTRGFVSGAFQQLPGPVLTLKIGNLHPASRVVYGGGGALLRLDVSPAGVTAPLDWYFAIRFEGTVSWITPSGLSPTPAPFAHMAPTLVSNARLFFTPFIGNTQTTFAIIATNGSTIFAVDHITSIELPSP